MAMAGPMASERKRIGLREVRELEPGDVAWDAAVPGFGARRQKSSAVSYFVFYRTRDGRQRWFTIGRHGAPWTPETARAEARRVLGEVAAGRDPAANKRAARDALTVAELCDRYLADMRAGRILTRRGESKRPATVDEDCRPDRAAHQAHPGPPARGGGRPGGCGGLHAPRGGGGNGYHGARQGPRRRARDRREGRREPDRESAERDLHMGLGKGLAAENPVRGVQRFADRRRERRLSDAEYAALGAGLRRGGGAACGRPPSPARGSSP